MPPQKAPPLDELIAHLRLPPLSRNELSMCATTVAALDATLREYNAATSEGITKLSQALTEVAQLDLEPRLKLDLLALFMSRVTRFTATLGQARLDDSAASLISASINLLKQMALGYKSLLPMLVDQWPNCGPQLMARALAACLDSLGLAYLRCLQLHLPAPSNLWTELNTLYRLTLRLEVHHIKVRMIDSAFKPELSLQDRYLRVLLLACAHPYQYENHELEQIHSLLAHWANLVTLAPAPEEEVFLIDITSNEGPFLATRHHQITATMLRIRTTRLVRHLQELQSHGPASIKVSPALVQKLYGTWGQEYSRNEDRVTILGHMELATGLTNAYALISAGIPLPIPAKIRPADWLSEVPKNAPASIEGKEINISKRGSCIELEAIAASQLSPGEIVAMRRTQRAAWSIAVVRWKRAKPDFSARFGLEIIARHALPCAVRQPGSTESSYRPGLLLPDDEDANFWRLITASTAPSQDSSVEILTALDTHKMDLGPAELITAGLSIHLLPGAEFCMKEEENWA